MSPAERRGLIRRNHPDLSIRRQCKLVNLSRSAFYYCPLGIDPDTLALMKVIDWVFTQHPFFGSRQVAVYLRLEGTAVGRHRVWRLMRLMGLQMIYKRPSQRPPSPGLSLSVEEAGYQPTQPSLVFGYYIYPGEARLSVSGGDYGLAQPESFELAPVEHYVSGFLR